MARTAHDPGHVAATTDGDWAAQAAGTIEGVVGSIRDKTTVPLTTAVRAIVYGLLAAIVGLVALVLGLAALSRALHELLDIGMRRESAVWAGYGVLGIIFTALGFLLWRKRTPKE